MPDDEKKKKAEAGHKASIASTETSQVAAAVAQSSCNRHKTERHPAEQTHRNRKAVCTKCMHTELTPRKNRENS